MLATNSAVILVLATVSVATDGTWGPGSGSQELAQARPHDLSVELQQVEHGRFSITTRFRLQGSNVPGELRIELWNGVEHPIAEANFSIRGVSHMHLRQVHGDQEHRVWLSPTMEAELAGDAPQLMPVFWSADRSAGPHASGWMAENASTRPAGEEPGMRGDQVGVEGAGLDRGRGILRWRFWGRLCGLCCGSYDR